MEAFLNAKPVLLPLAYLLVALDYGARFFLTRSLTPRSPEIGLRAAIVLHIGFLIAQAIHWQHFPATSVSQALSIIAFAVAVVYAFVEWHSRERSTGFFLVSLCFAFSLLSSLSSGTVPPEGSFFANPYLMVHVSLALIGYAAFAIAASYGFLYLRLYQELKAGRFSTFFGKLPPLETLDRMMSGALLAGFVALTGAIVLGMTFASRTLPAGTWFSDPKSIMTLATWLLYAVALLLRQLRQWQGRQVAIACLAGLVAMLFSFFVVNLWFSAFHSFL